jgi:hypothetical protein
MSVIRVNFLPEFYYGDDAVLLTLDGGGVDEWRPHHQPALVQLAASGSAVGRVGSGCRRIIAT